MTKKGGFPGKGEPAMDKLRAIMEAFAASDWELIAVPAQRSLADAECGSFGCELDLLYKRAGAALMAMPRLCRGAFFV